MVKCLECYHMHQPEENMERYHCLRAGGVIEHEIDEDVTCEGFTPLTALLNRNR